MYFRNEKERQQPKNVESYTKAYRNAECLTENQRKSVRRKQLALDENHLHKKPKETGFVTAKSETAKSNFPYVQALESHNAIPQDKRPLLRQGFLRS